MAFTTQRRRLQRPLKAAAAACLLLCPPSFAVSALAQSTTAPAPVTKADKASKPGPAALPADTRDMRRFTGREIAQRPYSAALPAPLYPTTPRTQKQFTVQYIFNYAEATYTPAVPLPLVSRAAVRRDTPEAALSAFYSAMVNGDYQGWLDCWDEPSRKVLEETTRKNPKGAESWRSAWREGFTGKRFMLIDRMETVNYIILDVRIENPAKPGAFEADQEVLIGQKGQWLLSNTFTNDGLIMNYQPGTTKAVKEFEVRPDVDLVGPAALTGQAQKEFLGHHLTTSSVTKTVE